ncbi:MFS transporter [Georgenia sp. H159]|uniref:MFS transporter n=1 Tax=Georgenia sp. H159 TaxID=3076115 RepID=UPI003A5CFFD2
MQGHHLTEQRRDAKSPRLIVPASLVAGASGWGMTAAGAGASTLADQYGTGFVAVGLLTTVFAAAYAGLQIPAGQLIDRFGVRRTALAGTSLTASAYLVALLVPVLGNAFVMRAVAGVSSAVGFVAGAELARRAGTGLVGLGIFGGFAIGFGGLAVAVVPTLEPVLGWTSAWSTCAVVAVAAAVVVWLMVPAGDGGRSVAAGSGVTRRPLLRDGELYRLTAIHAVTLGLGVVLSNWAAVVLTDRWGVGRTSAVSIASLILVLTIVSRPLGGAIVGRYPGSVRPMTVSCLLVCAGSTVALAFPSSAGVAAAAALGLGVAGGLPFSAVLASAQRWRPDRPAAAVGMLNAGANLLVVLGTPVVAGAIESGRTTLALIVFAVLWLTPIAMLPRTFRPDPAPRRPARPRRPSTPSRRGRPSRPW